MLAITLFIIIILPPPVNLKIKISETVILPLVLYACEIWSLTQKEVRRFEGVLEQICEDYFTIFIRNKL